MVLTDLVGADNLCFNSLGHSVKGDVKTTLQELLLPRAVKSIEAKSIMMVASGGGEKSGEFILKGQKFHFGKMKNSRDGCGDDYIIM